MKKLFHFVLPAFLLVAQFCAAQTDNTDKNGGGERQKMFSPVHLTEDKSDVFDITGIGNVVYTTSNTADATANSYRHSLKITIELFTAKNKTGNYQLIFYSPDDKIPYSASFLNDVLNIYYPLSVYESVREKLDQSLAAKKKVQVKVIQKVNGYREGTLIL